MILDTDRPPSDSSMIRHFYEHEEEFEMLLEQVDEWPGNWLTVEYAQHPDSYIPRLDEAREVALQEQLERLGLESIGASQEDMNDSFTAHMQVYGFGKQKGYAYLSNPNWQKVHDENLNKMDVYDRVVFRRIKGNWFLYLRGKERE